MYKGYGFGNIVFELNQITLIIWKDLVQFNLADQTLSNSKFRRIN